MTKTNSSKTSNEFLEVIDNLIETAKDALSKSPKFEAISDRMVNGVEGFLYSNLITNFKNNLAGDNLKELNISKSDVNNVEDEFGAIFEKCRENLRSGSNIGEIDSEAYRSFKNKLNKISKNAYKLLLEIEKHVDFSSCEKKIAKFKKEAVDLGKELKIEQTSADDKSMGVSIGFEGGGDWDGETQISEKITDFDNFSILDIEDDWITLEDKMGNFSGSFSKSGNGKYFVVYDDGYIEDHEDGDDKLIPGQVYLIQDRKKILWQKDITRPSVAFVNDNGTVIVNDWGTPSEEGLGVVHGKIYVFNNLGKKLAEYAFNGDVVGQAISKNGKELIITTRFPENAIYLFDIANKKLVKKIINATQQKPLVDFEFERVRGLLN